MILSAATDIQPEIAVKEAPPAAVSENRPAAPGPEYVWKEGCHRWDGHRYRWDRGRWEVPPRRYAHWCTPRWEFRGGFWIFVEGYWY